MTNSELETTTNETFILRALDKALKVQAPLAAAHVARLRRKSPGSSPPEILRRLNNEFRASTVTTGAGVGAAAAAPGVGTGVAISLSGGEFVTFLGATALYVLARGEVHGIRTADVERQRLLVTAILLGQSANRAIPVVAERTGQHWAKAVVKSIPMSSVRQVNRVLGRSFVTKYGSKQGIIVLGKVAPFGIGAVIGGTVNGVISQGIIRASNAAFGPIPSSWDGSVADDDVIDV